MKNIKLPSGWQEVKLGDVAKIVTGGTPSTKIKEYWGGNILWMNSGELNNKYIYNTKTRITEEGLKNSNARLIPIESVLIGLAGQGKTRGTVAINYVELCTNQSVASILPNDYFIQKYLYYQLEMRYNELRSLSYGDGGRGGLNLKILNNLIVIIPPLDDQKRIADILSLCDDIIENLTKLIEKKELYKKGMMQRVLTGKVRFNGFTDEWETVRLGDIAEMSSGGTPSTKNKEYYNGDIIWVAIKDITSSNKFLYDSEKKITKEGLNNSSAKLFPINTILYAMYASIGECIIAKVECATSQAILGIECSEKIDFTFLYYLLVNYKNNAKKMRQTGTQPNLNKQIVSDFQFYIPKMKEQKRIAELLSAIDDEIDNLKKQLELRKLQKKGLMQRLLTGEVRV